MHPSIALNNHGFIRLVNGMRKRKWRALSLFALTLVLVLSIPQGQEVRAQPSAVQTKPKIGLVLGGGGALGLAHVGVIAELEKLGIKPDLIVGTSMGAVVGSLYAAGYDAKQLEEIAVTLDWPSLFQDQGARDRLDFRRKEEERTFSTSFKLSIQDGGIKLPSSVIQGQRLKNELTSYLTARAATDDFDQLPTPFRAVATNIETFEPHVMSQGDLGSAVFASMAVPGLLPPQSIDDKLLVDGGLAANVPVEIARNMGADILIVVNLASSLSKAEEIQDVFGVLGQLVTFMTLRNEKENLSKLTEQDVLLSPDLEDFSSTDFGKAVELIALGRQTIQGHEEALRRVAQLSHGSEDRIAIAAETPPVRIADIRVENASTYPEDFILDAINQKRGEPLDHQQLKSDIDELYGTDEFSTVTYRLDTLGDGTGDLVVSVEPAERGNLYAQFGLNLATDFETDSDFNFLFGLIRRNLTDSGAELRGALSIGDDPALFAEFYQPTDVRHTWFWSAAGSVSRDKETIFDGGSSAVGEINIDRAALEIAGGRVFDRLLEVRAGVRHEWFRVRNSIGFEDLVTNSFDATTAVVRVSMDTLDDPFFPERGVLAFAEYNQILNESDDGPQTSDVNGTLFAGTPLLDGTLFGRTEYGFSLNSDRIVLETTTGTLESSGIQMLGGPGRLSGLTQDSLVGDHKLFGSLGYYRPIIQSGGLFESALYAGASFEAGNVYGDLGEVDLESLLLGGTVFVSTSTPIGPVTLGVGLTEDDASAFLRLGPTF